MHLLRSFCIRMLNMFRRPRLENDLREQIETHREMVRNDLIDRGMDFAEAEAVAKRMVGNETLIRELSRNEAGIRMLDDAVRDTHHAIRGLMKRPGFTLVIVLTLALGIGANTTVFSVVNGVLLRPLPYKGSHRLVRVYNNRLPEFGGPVRDPVMPSYRYYPALAQRTQTLAKLAAYESVAMTWSGRDAAIRLVGAKASPSMFPMLGAQAVLGRLFDPAEEAVGFNRVVVLSYPSWREYFGGNANVLGQVLILDGNGYTVVGIMQAGFELPPEASSPRQQFHPDRRADFWIPLSPVGASLDNIDNRSSSHQVIARLKDGVSLQDAAADITSILQQIDKPRIPPDRPRIELAFVEDELVAPVRPALRLLMIAVGFVLLIACANVANLMLARTAATQREIAIRSALGAGRGRLIRQVLTESAILSLLGGLAGTGLAFGALDLVKRLGAANIPRLEEIAIDPTVFAFTAGVSLLTSVVFGLGPAFRTARTSEIEVIRESRAAASGGGLRGRYRSRSVLVIAELALATILLAGAGLLIRSFITLVHVDPGYNAKNVLTFLIPLPLVRHADPLPFQHELVDRIQRLPGVKFAGAATWNDLPIAGNGTQFLTVMNLPDRPNVVEHIVSPDYVPALGIRMLEGRGFDQSDTAGQPGALLVNKTFARRFFQNESALGKSIIGEGAWQIVGVVDDIRHAGLDAEPRPEVYMSTRQYKGVPFNFARMYHVVRTDGDPEALSAAIRKVVHEMDPQLALYDVATMEQRISTSNTVARPRFYTVLLGIFAAVALALGAIGIYGVMSYGVTERTREIGIRIALGARRSEVLALVLKRAAALAAIGLVLGLSGALLMSRYLETMLFGVTARDLTTFAAVPVVFGLVAVLACYLPARRATRVDPLVALRYE